MNEIGKGNCSFRWLQVDYILLANAMTLDLSKVVYIDSTDLLGYVVALVNLNYH